MKALRVITVLFLSSFLFMFGCGGNSNEGGSAKSNHSIKPHPEPNADSVFQFVADQVAFGPRVPGTEAHANTANWFKQKFEEYGASVQIQQWEQQVYSGETVTLKNIIASINPSAKKRILLAAHWDTRPFADRDEDDKYAPIDGANDGGSGVAVILELARVISNNTSPTVGVDMILFDGEDWGEHNEGEYKDLPEGLETWWCLGSQYWSKNKHKSNYTAYYGILLDMVGASGAKFKYDDVSRENAGRILEKVWSQAHSLGYENYFSKTNGFPGIIDDHVYVNKHAGIPMIDIIDHRDSGTGFTPVWHTVNDNLDAIDKQTLYVVTDLLLSILYNE